MTTVGACAPSRFWNGLCVSSFRVFILYSQRHLSVGVFRWIAASIRQGKVSPIPNCCYFRGEGLGGTNCGFGMTICSNSGELHQPKPSAPAFGHVLFFTLPYPPQLPKFQRAYSSEILSVHTYALDRLLDGPGPFTQQGRPTKLSTSLHKWSITTTPPPSPFSPTHSTNRP